MFRFFFLHYILKEYKTKKNLVQTCPRRFWTAKRKGQRRLEREAHWECILLLQYIPVKKSLYKYSMNWISIVAIALTVQGSTRHPLNRILSQTFQGESDARFQNLQQIFLHISTYTDAEGKLWQGKLQTNLNYVSFHNLTL